MKVYITHSFWDGNDWAGDVCLTVFAKYEDALAHVKAAWREHEDGNGEGAVEPTWPDEAPRSEYCIHFSDYLWWFITAEKVQQSSRVTP